MFTIFVKIDGGYEKVVNSLLEKKKVLLEKSAVQEDFVVLNSFDGAICGITNKKQLNITLYSLSIVSVGMLKRGLRPASTNILLTWEQVIGDEKIETVFPVVKALYKWIGQNICAGLIIGENITIYEVHDYKILYNLLQCSMWNWKNYPFALCKCLKGDSVANPNHICTLITDEDHVQLW